MRPLTKQDILSLSSEMLIDLIENGSITEREVVGILWEEWDNLAQKISEVQKAFDKVKDEEILL